MSSHTGVETKIIEEQSQWQMQDQTQAVHNFL